MDTSISCLIKASTKYDFDFECCLLIIRLKKVFPKIGPNLNEWTFHSQAQYSPFVVIGMFLVNWFYDVLYYLGTITLCTLFL